MASIYTNTNLYGFNQKQLEHAAQNVAVANVHANTIPAATLRTAIQAK